MTVDNISEPGAWVREWDARPHSTAEYRQEIHELRERVRMYLARIGELEAELNAVRARSEAWVQEP